MAKKNLVENAQVAENAAMQQVRNANAQVADNKSALAGMQEDVVKHLIKGYRNLLRGRCTINGRLIDLASCAGDYRKVVASGEFKGAVKCNLDHLTLVQTDGKGNVVGTYQVPVKFVPLASRDNYNDYTIDDIVVKILERKSAKNWSLAGYTHDSESVDTADFAALRHEYTHEVTRTQSAIAADGTTVTVPVYESIVDENGNTVKKVVKDAVTETYVPVYCDTCTPKAFEKAVEKAVASMWLKLFAK